MAINICMVDPPMVIPKIGYWFHQSGRFSLGWQAVRILAGDSTSALLFNYGPHGDVAGDETLLFNPLFMEGKGGYLGFNMIQP